MATGSPKPSYLTYNDYEYFRKKFNPDWVTRFNTDVFNKVINKTTDEKGKQKYDSIFREIFRHISNSNVFMFDDSAKACNYISYILYKEVEKKSNVKYNEDTFNTTKKFVQKFKDEYGYTNEFCESKMVYLDSKIYEKLKYLYDLYDKYYEYTKNVFRDEYVEKCNTLGYAIQYHNHIVDNYEEDSDLINKSLVMKGLIEKLALQPYDKCQYRKDQLHKSKIESNPPREQSEVDTKARPQVESLKAQLEESVSRTIIASEGRTRTQEQQQQADITHGQKEHQEHHTNSVTIDHSNETESRAVSVDYRGPVHNHLSRQYGHPSHEVLSIHNKESGRFPEQGYYRERGYSYDSQLENNLGSLEERNNILGDPLSSSSEGRGFIHNVKDTISGIIGEVDPIPVVGVSGGMGALFLLFRYTPLGTFFRGGRGRSHRIPRSFNGQFLGGFPGYEEYDVGHIGYGPMNMNPLAE
ncbi:PIR protein [Plasmodium vivax]|uniref:VIR protein n=1 Tax=Plasmodium vivax TaxID=5855 RepID=A0A565A4Z4_PLAVI|nr:PIR protein [Plasmodium vivax]